MNRGESMDGLLCLTLFNTLLVILCVSFQSLLTTFSHGGHLSRPLLIIMNHHKMHVSHIPHSSDCPGTSVLICVVVFSRPFQNKSDEIIMFPGEIQKFLWYSYGIPMVFLWFQSVLRGPTAPGIFQMTLIVVVQLLLYDTIRPRF